MIKPARRKAVIEEKVVELEDLKEQAGWNQPSEIVRTGDPGESGSKSLSLYRGETYYHLPALKPSYYGWKIGASFFLVGTGGASQILASIIDFTGKKEDRPLIRAGRYLALSGSLITSAIFIADLHNPGRWYNMMRIFRRTSWMSIGSWCLASFAALSGLTAVAQLIEDAGFKWLGRWISRLFQVPAAAAGGMLCLYSGAELEATSLPLWEKSFPLLPALFAAENASSAASAMLLVTKGSERFGGIRKQLEKFSFLAGAVEEILYRLVSSRWEKSALDGFSRPDPELSMPLSSIQRIGMISSLFIRMIRTMKRRSAHRNPTLSQLLTLGSGLLLPIQVILAGNESGQRPEEYFSGTQPSPFSEEPEGARMTSGDRKQRIRPLNHLTTFVGLGLFVIGAAAILFSSTKKSDRTRDGHCQES